MPKRKSTVKNSKKTKETRKEVADGRTEVADGRTEVADGRTEVADGSEVIEEATANNAKIAKGTPQPIESAMGALAIHVPQETKQKIVNGEYVDLSSLLIENCTNTSKPKTKLVILKGELISENINKIKIYDIRKWTDAFLIYISIFISAHPDKTQELLKYMHLIRLAESRSANDWLSYDQQYRLRKAYNPTTSWSDLDNELWGLYMTPTQYHATTFNSSVVQKGKCFEYNNNGFCNKNPCIYLHTCLKCSKEHPAFSCFQNQSSVIRGGNSSFQRFRFQSRNEVSSMPNTMSIGRGNPGFSQSPGRPRFAPRGQTVQRPMVPRKNAYQYN